MNTNECAHEHIAVYSTGHMWVGENGVEDDYREIAECLDCGQTFGDEADLDDIPF
jgi:hypothetical protein